LVTDDILLQSQLSSDVRPPADGSAPGRFSLLWSTPIIMKQREDG